MHLWQRTAKSGEDAMLAGWTVRTVSNSLEILTISMISQTLKTFLIFRKEENDKVFNGYMLHFLTFFKIRFFSFIQEKKQTEPSWNSKQGWVQEQISVQQGEYSRNCGVNKTIYYLETSQQRVAMFCGAISVHMVGDYGWQSFFRVAGYGNGVTTTTAWRHTYRLLNFQLQIIK